MRQKPDDLDRLLSSAAKSSRHAENEAPYGLEGRVMAEWRANRQSDPLDGLTLLRRFLMFSLALGVAVGAMHFTTYNIVSDPIEHVADSALLTAIGQ